MQHPLPTEYVGKGLGMIKFEDDIKLGFFADKKLYYGPLIAKVKRTLNPEG
jgi:hypothetical protein